MAKKNLSLTPFARLLLVLLVAGPLSYIGASYYNGEDGVQNIKNLFGIGAETEMERAVTETGDTYNLEAENKSLRKEIKALKQENEDLRKQLEE